MQKINVTCSACGGTGKIVTYEIIERNNDNGTGTCQGTEAACDICNGKGYMEFVMFSPEEGRAILKHCGLDTAS